MNDIVPRWKEVPDSPRTYKNFGEWDYQHAEYKHSELDSIRKHYLRINGETYIIGFDHSEERKFVVRVPKPEIDDYHNMREWLFDFNSHGLIEAQKHLDKWDGTLTTHPTPPEELAMAIELATHKRVER